jgi:signal transduction histidine kinase
MQQIHISLEEAALNLGTVSIGKDVTEINRLNRQLIQAEKLSSIGELVAGVAHEINNPINTIMNNAPLLRDVWQDLLPLLEEHIEKEPGRRARLWEITKKMKSSFRAMGYDTGPSVTPIIPFDDF